MTVPNETKQDISEKIVKHSLNVAGHRTSISLERVFWEELRKIAAARGQSLANLVAAIGAGRGGANLSSAIRVFVLNAARRSRSGRTRRGLVFTEHCPARVLSSAP
jgi:predicted DNA-binding ribbon-helix-helix protein